MKKVITILTALLATSSVFAAGEHQLFGEAGAALVYSDHEGSNAELQNDSSDFGIKGSIGIPETDTKAIYKLKLGLNIADKNSNESDAIKLSDTWIGLKGSWGKIIAGRENTSLDWGVLSDPEVVTGPFAAFLDGGSTLNNNIQYTSPSFGPFKAQFGTSLSEDTSVDDVYYGALELDFTHDNNGFGIAIGLENYDEKQIIRTAASYTINNFRIGAIHESKDVNGFEVRDENDVMTAYQEDERLDTIILSLSYEWDKNSVAFEAGSKEVSDFDETMKSYTLAYHRKLAKGLNMYIAGGTIDDSTGDTSARAAIGMIYSFKTAIFN